MIPTNSVAFNPMSYRPGTVLSTSRFLYRHFGILTDHYINGYPAVISNSGERGMVVEEPLNTFQGTGDLKVEGYFGSLSPDAVLERARAQRGSRYTLLRWNCEQFVRYAHGLKLESPQVTAVVTLCMAMLAIYGLSRA